MKTKQYIFMTGGTGLLGTEVLKIDSQIIAPSSSECNILSYSSLEENLDKYKPFQNK